MSCPLPKKRLLSIEVIISVEVDEHIPIVLDDIYTDLNKAKVKYDGKTIGKVYDWTTGEVRDVTNT